MTISDTRRWLVELVPDQLLGMVWHRNSYTIRVTGASARIVATTDGPMTYGGLAHVIVTNRLYEGERVTWEDASLAGEGVVQ